MLCSSRVFYDHSPPTCATTRTGASIGLRAAKLTQYPLTWTHHWSTSSTFRGYALQSSAEWRRHRHSCQTVFSICSFSDHLRQKAMLALPVTSTDLSSFTANSFFCERYQQKKWRVKETITVLQCSGRNAKRKEMLSKRDNRIKWFPHTAAFWL